MNTQNVRDLGFDVAEYFRRLPCDHPSNIHVQSQDFDAAHRRELRQKLHDLMELAARQVQRSGKTACHVVAYEHDYLSHMSDIRFVQALKKAYEEVPPDL